VWRQRLIEICFGADAEGRRHFQVGGGVERCQTQASSQSNRKEFEFRFHEASFRWFKLVELNQGQRSGAATQRMQLQVIGFLSRRWKGRRYIVGRCTVQGNTGGHCKVRGGQNAFNRNIT
jgi:hypothetical protein